MDLISQAQLFEGDVLEVVFDDHVIKFLGNLEGMIEAFSSTAIDENR